MRLSNRTYDVLKWIVLIFMPALIAFYGLLGATLHIPYTDIVLTILGGFDTFLGSLIGVSTSNYNKEGEDGNSIRTEDKQ